MILGSSSFTRNHVTLGKPLQLSVPVSSVLPVVSFVWSKCSLFREETVSDYLSVQHQTHHDVFRNIDLQGIAQVTEYRPNDAIRHRVANAGV